MKVKIPWSILARTVVCAVVGLGVIAIVWFAIRLSNIVLGWALYSWFFQQIHDAGILPDRVTGALAVCCLAVVFLIAPSVVVSFFFKDRRWAILAAAGALSTWMLGLHLLSLPHRDDLFNPFTKRANFVYVRLPDNSLRRLPLGYLVDPQTGIETQPLTTGVAQEYLRQETAEQAKTPALEKSAADLERAKQALERCQARMDTQQPRHFGRVHVPILSVTVRTPAENTSPSSTTEREEDPALGGATAAMASSGASRFQNLLCKDALDGQPHAILEDHSTESTDTLQITLRPGCFSGYIILPGHWNAYHMAGDGNQRDWWFAYRWYADGFHDASGWRGPLKAVDLDTYSEHQSHKIRVQGNGELQVFRLD